MKPLIAIAIILLCWTASTGQTKRLSRTRERPHGVDSVSSWQLHPDSTGLMKDSSSTRRNRR